MLLRSIIPVLFAACPLLAADLPNLLKNPGFENGFSVCGTTTTAADGTLKISGSLGDGWSDNSDWADVRVLYTQERSTRHGGEFAQRITAVKFGSGAIQFVQQLDLQQGHNYAFSVWVRGTPGTSMELTLRKRTEPYTTYASTSVPLTGEWQQHAVSGTASEAGEGFVMLRLAAVGEAFIDDATLVDTTK